MLALMSVVGEHSLVRAQVGEKAEASDASGADSLTVNLFGASHQVAQVVPVEFFAFLEFPHEERGIEGIASLPELQHHKPADERLVKRPDGVNARIIMSRRPD
jgi:hypothetical protein